MEGGKGGRSRGTVEGMKEVGEGDVGEGRGRRLVEAGCC